MSEVIVIATFLTHPGREDAATQLPGGEPDKGSIAGHARAAGAPAAG
jgi:hypothetical protein